MTRTVKIMVILGFLALCGTAWGVEPIPNLIAHWTFDEGSGATAYDSVGDNHGTIYGAQWTTGQIDGALSFDGVDDYVGLGSPANLDDLPLNNLTISAWIFDESCESWGTIIGCHFKNSGWSFRRHGIALHFQASHQTTWAVYESSDGTISTNTWHHVVAVWDASTKTAKLYIDGTEPLYQTATPGTGRYRPDALNDKEIGRIPHVGGVHYFDGTIDDVRIYDRTLSPGEVQQLYQDGVGELVGLEIVGPNEVAENSSASYKAIAYYDSNSTKDVTDSADWQVEPNSFASIETGLLTTEGIDRPEEDITIYAQYTEGEVTVEAERSVTVFAICPSGSALSFDGDDYVSVPDSDSLDMSSSKNMTMGAWIILKSTGNNLLFAKSDGSDPKYEILIGSQRLGWWIDDGPNYKGDTDDADTISLNEWHYVAIVFDRTNNHIIRYLDGQQTGTIDNFGSVGDLYNSKPFIIGARADLVAFFDGIIDEGAIYERALSAEEIRANMHTRPTCDEPGLVGYWDFDEGEGQVAYDLSPYGNHGQLGSTPDADASDPAWIESDAPIGICIPVVEVVGLEIIGPEEIAENSSAQYTAIAYYNGVCTADVTTLAIWSLEPQECGSINENGVLTTDRIEILENITIYAQYTEGEVTVDAEMTVQVSPPVDLEITGPQEVWGTNPAQYEAVVYYDNGQTDTVTDSVLWWTGPNSLATIIDEHGLLHTERIETPQEYITIYAQYTATGITLQTEMTVRVSLPVDLEITGPQGVRGSCSAQYEVVVYYDNGQTDTVTDSALWWAEPDTLATIEAGLLWTEEIDEPRDIIIYSQYTVTGVTLQAEMEVAATLPQTLYVPSKYETIQAAINAAEHCDIIVVAPGTYTGPGNRDIDFLGKPITVRSENGPESCIIDCQGGGRGFYFQKDEDMSSILDGFTIINGYAWQGGGISCWGSSPTITNCTITGNTAGHGGGIYCYQSSPTITNCIITGNTANGDGGGGGIFCDYGSNPAITNCTISGNSAWIGGGIYSGSYTSPVIGNCIITGNSAEVYGGGMYFRYSNLTITNCTFAGNSAPNGNALAYDFWWQEHPSNVQMTNCILWDGGSEIWNNDGSTITITYSDVQGSWPGEGNIDEDPHFALSTDYHLMPDSPCIDAGTNTPTGGLTETDIDGNPRPMDGNSDTNAIADMGAYEFNPNSPSIAVSATTFSFFPNWPQPHPQTLLIRNCGGTMLHWEIVQDCNWLEVVPTTGVSTGNINEVTLTVDTNSLAPGYYTCTLKVRDPYAANNPVTVLVTMVVGEILRVPDDFLTIQAAINAADDYYDIVLVADGNYTGQGNTNIDFRGKSITVCSENGPNNCTINCQDYGCAFLFRSGETAGSHLKGFTIINGDQDGGGIDCRDSSPVISNCILKSYAFSERVEQSGITCWGGNPTIINCTISGYLGDHTCAGISCIYGSPTITNCTITGNSAPQGGGIFCDLYSSPTITNCTISDNIANWGGGGIYCENSSPTITNCTISGNSAGYNGGGMCNIGSDPTVTNCTFSGNSAEEYGGGMYNASSNPTVTNCTFSGNLAGINAGGMFNAASNSTVTNCTFSGNSAEGDGGGMSNWNSNPMVTNCTFSENSASNGNALDCDSWSQLYPSNVQMTNCILADGGDEIWNNDGSIITITYSDVQGGWPGEGNIDADPCFVDSGYWADVNDANIIVEPNDPNAVWINGDYHLLAGSPCIDAATDAGVYTDIEGNIRPFDFPGVDNNGELPEFDMGAYEAMVSCFSVNHIKLETKAGKKGNEVELKGTFDPAVPIDFVVDDVAYIIDDGQGNALAFLIPAGSFEVDGKPGKQKFKFDSPKHSQPDIKAEFDFDKCKFELKAKRVQGTDEITSTTLTIELWAGANVVEEVVQVQVKPKHTEYKREPKLDCCPKCKGIALLEITSTDPFTGDEYVLLFEPELGKDKLKANTVVDDGVNGRVKIDTSCSKPLEVGDVFGVYTVTDLIKIFDDCPDDD